MIKMENVIVNDGSDCGLPVPGPVHGVGDDEARILRLYCARVLWYHTLLLGPGSGTGLHLPDEEGAGGVDRC